MSWWHDGLCRDPAFDVELFFGPSHEMARARQAREAVACAVCEQCPVMSECLADACANRDHGVRGGTTEQTRARAGYAPDAAAGYRALGTAIAHGRTRRTA